MDIKGARVLVTGGASGIGYALSEELLKDGARVFIVDIEQDSLERAIANLKATPGRDIRGATADVSSVEAMAALGQNVRDAFGGVDILINNAGVIYHSKPIWETPPEMVEWSFAVNVTGVINGLREFLPQMIAQGHGHVVNTASMAGFQVRKNTEWYQGLYAATKFSVVAISEALRQDLRTHGIGVSVLAPSAVSTNISHSDQRRPDRFGDATTGSSPEFAQRLADIGMPPALVAAIVVDAIRADRLYVFTHVKDKAVVEERAQHILAGFDEAVEVLGRLDPSWLPQGP